MHQLAIAVVDLEIVLYMFFVVGAFGGEIRAVFMDVGIALCGFFVAYVLKDGGKLFLKEVTFEEIRIRMFL